MKGPESVPLKREDAPLSGDNAMDAMKEERRTMERQEKLTCPKCGSTMDIMTLEGGIERYSCPKDGSFIDQEAKEAA